MINISFNGIDMSGKTTLMKATKETLEEKGFKIAISPHLMMFTDMGFKQRLAMYEEWSSYDFTSQSFMEVCKRAEDVKERLSEYDYVLNDRGVLTQIGFAMGKYMTEEEFSLEKSYKTVKEKSRSLPLEDLSITIDLSLEKALERAEGKENWYDHYQRLITNTRKAIQYLTSQEYATEVLHLQGFKRINELNNLVTKKILN